jgi:hypothetical protein
MDGRRRFAAGFPPVLSGSPLSSLFLVASLLAASGAFGQTRLYLGEYQYNNPKLKGMNLDGTGVAELFSPPASDWLLVGCGSDLQAGKIYWTHGSTPGTIRRANLDGTDGQLLVSGLKLPRGVSLDLAHGKMYWTQAPPQGNANGLIMRANLDGSGLETFYTLTPYDPVYSYVGKPAVDPVNGYVYFGAAQQIRRARIDGSGPVQVLAGGFNTPIAVALDSAHGQIYFLDANTNSDVLGRVGLDDTGFTVIADLSPGVNQSSGLFDLRLDLSAGKAYFTDEIAKKVRRCNLDGSALEEIYTSPASLAPTGICFDQQPDQPILDCNGNGVRDLDDIDSGVSQDCNGNGVPDECENRPCAAREFLVDNGSNPVPNGRALSGDSQTGYEIFQPFDFASIPGVDAVLSRIGIDGWTVNYDPAGFRATLFPDDGSGTFPDESAPIMTADFQLRFSPDSVAWVDEPFPVILGGGRYWVRLTANDPDYDASVNVGLRGEPSLSRRNSDGGIVHSTASIALRLEYAPAASVGAPPVSPAGTLIAFGPAVPNPAPRGRPLRIPCSLTSPALVSAAVYDAAGRRVRVLSRASMPAGLRWIEWRATDDRDGPVAAGVYFVRACAVSEADVSTGSGPRSGTATRSIVLVP